MASTTTVFRARAVGARLRSTRATNRVGFDIAAGSSVRACRSGVKHGGRFAVSDWIQGGSGFGLRALSRKTSAAPDGGDNGRMRRIIVFDVNETLLEFE